MANSFTYRSGSAPKTVAADIRGRLARIDSGRAVMDKQIVMSDTWIHIPNCCLDLISPLAILASNPLSRSR